MDGRLRPPPSDPRGPVSQPVRAIIAGASIAGLVAARVLSDTVDEVVVLDRDVMSGGPEGRAGVPQANHLHVLLHRGYVELTRLFPELERRLASAGAPAVDWIGDAVWITPGGEAARWDSGLRSRAASRGLLESVLRELVLGRANVSLLEGHDVTGLLGGRGGITGIRYRLRPSDGRPADMDATGVIEGWLVVDATGRGSRLPDMLTELGLSSPEETVIDASLRYASRLYHAPASAPDWRVMVVRDRPPSSTRGGGILSMEDDRWLVTLGGAGGRDQPPTDEAGFLAFARSLISPRLHDAIAGAEPAGDIRGWARMANRWRHVERMADWPAGLAVMGDTLCALNPIYGQGMSVAAVEGGVLGAWLRSAAVQRARTSGTSPVTGDLIRGLAKAARLPWLLATAEDSRIDGVRGAARPGPMAAFLYRYLDEILLLAARDRYTQRRFMRVTQLVRPPVTLFDPLVVGKVAGAVVRRKAGRDGAARAGGSVVPMASDRTDDPAP
jgi:2-polyprenyl-6-methoxyphenol hydroxylase-like FAD-dependent oxidoreductase